MLTYTVGIPLGNHYLGVEMDSSLESQLHCASQSIGVSDLTQHKRGVPGNPMVSNRSIDATAHQHTLTTQ